MAVELATAYISLVPSAKGISDKIGDELGGLDTVAADVGGAAGDSYSGKFMGVAGTALASGALALGAVFTKGLLDAIDVEAAGQKLNAQLGATGAYAEDLGEIAGSLYADAYGGSLGDVNEALRNVLQQGLVDEDATNEQIEAVTAKVLDLATAFDQDVGGATSAVSQLLRTGLVDSADEALDVLTRGFQQGADVQGDLLDTIREYSTQFRKLGLDADDATGLMSQGLNAGARDADIVADALKEFSIRAVDGSELTAEGFAALGLSADEMTAKIAAGGPEAADALDLTLAKLGEIEDPALRAQTAVALFGTQAEDLGDALFALDPSEASKSLGEIAGAATEMGDTLNDTSAARIEAFKRKALGGLSDFIGDRALPALESLGDWADGVDFAGAVDDFRAGMAPVTDWYATDAAPVLDDIATGIGDAFSGVATWISDQVGPVTEAVGHILNVITGLWDIFGGTLTTWVVDVWNFIRSTIENVINVIRGIIEFVLAVINGDWAKAWDAIVRIATAVWDQILSVIGLALDTLKAILSLAWDAIAFGVGWVWGEITERIDGAWDWITGKVDGAIDTIKTGVASGFETVKTLITTPIDAAKSLVTSLFDDLVGLFEGLPGKLGDALGGLADAAVEPFEKMGELIADAWNNTIGGFSFTIPDLPGVPGRGTKVEIPELHAGGPVTGRPGTEVLRILEAGEWVLSRAEVADLRRTGGAGLGAAGAGAGLSIGTLAVTTIADATADEVVGAINAKLGWAHTARRDR